MKYWEFLALLDKVSFSSVEFTIVSNNDSGCVFTAKSMQEVFEILKDNIDFYEKDKNTIERIYFGY